MAIVRHTKEELKKIKGKTDAERLKNITEEELEEAAKSDPDSAWPTDEELKKFKRPSEEYRKRFLKDDD